MVTGTVVVQDQRHLVSRHRHASPRQNRTLFTSSRPSRSTVSIAAGTALAAAAAATALTIGPASITRPAPRIAASRFDLAGHLAPGTGQHGASQHGASQHGADHGTAASKPGYSTDVAATLREQHAYQARAQAASNAAAVQRARLAARKALVLAEQEREPASQQPVTAQPATGQPATGQPATGQPTATAPAGSPQQIAMSMLADFGWSSSEFSCLDPLWERESGWNPYADNPISGAYGIPQALPGSKMASAGADWQSDAATQIRWGLGYIKATYGSPCGAWDHEESYGWY